MFNRSFCCNLSFFTNFHYWNCIIYIYNLNLGHIKTWRHSEVIIFGVITVDDYTRFTFAGPEKVCRKSPFSTAVPFDCFNSSNCMVKLARNLIWFIFDLCNFLLFVSVWNDNYQSTSGRNSIVLRKLHWCCDGHCHLVHHSFSKSHFSMIPCICKLILSVSSVSCYSLYTL